MRGQIRMYFQFLVEDKSTEILIDHVMEKLKQQYAKQDIFYAIKPFGGIGHLPRKGTPLERKTGKLLNDLPMFLRAFDKKFRGVPNTAIIVVMDNDKRNPEEFQAQLSELTVQNMILSDHVFCIAVKEMEAWLLGDMDAIEKAYPTVRKSAGKGYRQDGICDTWEVLADMVYPGGLKRLKKRAGDSYAEIGSVKMEWADKIGQMLDISRNLSPSFRRFICELTKRMETA